MFVSYISTRCGILFVVISERYKNLPNAQNVYKQSLNNAAFFTKFSSAAYEVAGGKTKAFQDRARTWAEIYGVKYIGSIKALTTAFMVFSTAFGTAIFGILIDHGFSIEGIALACTSYIVLVTILLLIFRKSFKPTYL